MQYFEENVYLTLQKTEVAGLLLLRLDCLFVFLCDFGVLKG